MDTRASSLVVGVWLCVVIAEGPVYARAGEEAEVAELLIALLRAGCSVVSEYQPLINDSSKGKKGFTGEFVERAIMDKFQTETQIDLAHSNSPPPNDLLLTMLQSEREVVSMHSLPSIDRESASKGLSRLNSFARPGKTFHPRLASESNLRGRIIESKAMNRTTLRRRCFACSLMLAIQRDSDTRG